MDKRKSILNVSVSIASRVILLLVALVVRRLLIQYIGNEANGLNALYSSIIGTLAVAELGVGRAIVYSMYSPIISNDKRQVAALYCLYKKLYLIIGSVVFLGGLVVMPFLPTMISDYDQLNANVYLTFFFTLISVVLTYLYSAKSSLIEAYKDNYITTIVLTIARLLKYGLQIAAIIIWRSFPMFLVCQILETLFIWGITDVVARQKHNDIISMRETIDKETKTKIVRNVKAMVMHKIGNTLVSGVDSLIISGFIGVAILGKYNNYTYIAGIMAGILTLFFTPLTSVVGHLCAAGDSEQTKGYFDYFYCINYILGVVFFMGYYAVIDSVVTLCFGSGLELSRAIAFIITLNQFTLYMRNSTHLFRNASGAFYYDRWKPLVEGTMNLVLSLIFVNVFPEELRIVGVIAATIITTLLICDTVEPYVVFRHVFKSSPQKFYLKNYMYIGLFIICLILMTFLLYPSSNTVIGILLNGSLSLLLSLTVLCLIAVLDKSFRSTVKTLIHRMIIGID